MRFFLRYCLLFFVACVAFATVQHLPAQQSSASASTLRSGFENPPHAAKLRCYWWWLNGYTTADTITRDLTELKAHGYAGVLLVDDAASSSVPGVPLGPDYGSPAWMALYLHALKIAHSLGLEISLEITDGGNVGILGGPGTTPADALKLLTWSRTQVAGGGERTVKLSAPPATQGIYSQIAVLAYPLRHGVALAGDPHSGRTAILDLAIKSASREAGDSMPAPSKVLREAPSLSGEQDADVSQVIDLSAHTTLDGTLRWKFPAGEWEILRIGYTPSKRETTNPSGTGFAVDAMSAQAFDHYWDRVVAPIVAASKPYIGTSLRYLVTDSWESGGTNWDAGFRQQFIRRRGYDPLPYLPIVSGRILSSRETSNRFLADLRRTVADLIAENYYDRFAQRAASVGLGIHPEAGGPHGGPFDALENFRGSAMMQTEFWAASPFHRTEDYQRFFVKEASSAAHIYGKRYVAAESFSRMGPPWDVSPARNLKPTFDRALTEGLNRVFWHQFTSSPVAFGKPGIEYFADTHLDPNVTWWKQSPPMLLALNRAQFLLQQGQPVSDLLYFYGDQVPGFVRLKSDDPAHVLPGYDYDVTNEDALLHRMIAAGGKLHTPEGIQYRALALPPWRKFPLPALQWIESYVRQGGTVIGLKPISPLGIVPPATTREFERIASQMWNKCPAGDSSAIVAYGAGHIACTQNAHLAFATLGIVPDFTYQSQSSNADLDYVHRTTPNAEIYFVRNGSDSPVSATLDFRVRGRAPELWNIDTGAVTPALVYTQKGAQTEVPLTFPGYGSVFVIFEHPIQGHAVSIERAGQPVFPSSEQGVGVYAGSGPSFALRAAEPGTYAVHFSDGVENTFTVPALAPDPSLGNTWTVNFPAGWGAPPSVAMTALESWTKSSNPGVRYFSGTATYHNTIDVPAPALTSGHEIWMDLGDVREVATVAVNGSTLRTLWHAPFRVRIDPALHAGSNTLSIQVTNLWPNRLIGDAQPDAKTHYTQTNVRVYTKDSPLSLSGLLTPVTLHVFDVVTLAAMPEGRAGQP